MKSITFTEIEKFPYTLKIKDKIHTLSKEELIEINIVFLKELLVQAQIDNETFGFLKEIEKHNLKPIPIVVARKKAFIIHELARTSTSKLEEYTYRALGHLIATIHVKTHSYQVLIYGIKAYYQLGVPKNNLETIVKNYYFILSNKNEWTFHSFF